VDSGARKDGTISTLGRYAACEFGVGVPASIEAMQEITVPDALTPPAAGPEEARGATGEDAGVRPAWATEHPLVRDYYDTEWGLPVHDEAGLLERMSLEVFQAGLSWATILRKRPAFRAAFHEFDADRVAGYRASDVRRLLGDAAIVRNRRKIEATIANARATVELRADGGLDQLLWSFRPAGEPVSAATGDAPFGSAEAAQLADELRRRGFTFVGPTMVRALMEAVGIIDLRGLKAA
jgi:DNA-3-methyladenine glycosylase I